MVLGTVRGRFPISDGKKQLGNWCMNSVRDHRSVIVNVIHCNETDYRRSADDLNLLLLLPDLAP